MEKKPSTKKSDETQEKSAAVSRRAFLTRTGSMSAVVAAAATGMISSQVVRAEEEKKSDSKSQSTSSETRVTKELSIPATADAPSQTEYKCDVLIIGGGYAGLNAAVSARKEGRSVIMVDKGRPGYSGLSGFPSSHRWFDPDFGDNAKAYRDCVQRGGEYIANLDWYQVWIDESKQTYQRLMDWKILTQFTRAADCGFDKSQDFPGYREKFDDYDRRAKFIKVLTDNDIQYLVRTMITDVIREDGRVVGAIGFDVPSGAVLTFQAKAVVMCMGGGSYKPTGYPTGANSFDGEYIGYNLGLPIVSKEFDDYHETVSWAAGNAFLNNSWAYLENMWLCGGDVTPENSEETAILKAKVMVQKRVLKAVKGLPNNDGTEVEDLSKVDRTRRAATLSGDPKDPRRGKNNAIMPKGDIYGAAVGMCNHLSSGIFCGLDDLVGKTGLPGLYVAGDGANGSGVSGAAYPNGVGFTSNFCSIQGWRAGRAAAQYAGGVAEKSPSASRVAELKKTILAPAEIKEGLDANWARDVLQAAMAPFWINISKDEATLRGALAQVEYLRDHVVPKLMAPSSHDLRLCHEVKHKVLSAEMKLRASLERRESRGLHYRTDYPFRDDKNFLCYITLHKNEEGRMELSKVPVKDAWKGNTGGDYGKRYGWRFPGEAEAMGLPAETKSTQNRG